jgi:hypothetical protein
MPFTYLRRDQSTDIWNFAVKASRDKEQRLACSIDRSIDDVHCDLGVVPSMTDPQVEQQSATFRLRHLCSVAFVKRNSSDWSDLTEPHEEDGDSTK